MWVIILKGFVFSTKSLFLKSTSLQTSSQTHWCRSELIIKSRLKLTFPGQCKNTPFGNNDPMFNKSEATSFISLTFPNHNSPVELSNLTSKLCFEFLFSLNGSYSAKKFSSLVPSFRIKFLAGTVGKVRC